MNKTIKAIATGILLTPTKMIVTNNIIFPKIVLNSDASRPGTAYNINHDAISIVRRPTSAINACLLLKNLFIENFSIYKFIIF